MRFARTLIPKVCIWYTLISQKQITYDFLNPNIKMKVLRNSYESMQKYAVYYISPVLKSYTVITIESINPTSKPAMVVPTKIHAIA